MNHKIIVQLFNNSTPSTLIYTLYEQSCDQRMAYSIAVTYGTKQAHAYDVTDDREAAVRFLHLLCKEGAEPCHLYDILEDFLPLK